jgi:hypothetical protein
MEDKTVILIIALSWLGVLEAIALCMGFDGVAFASVIGAIAGLAGYEIKDHSEALRRLFSR